MKILHKALDILVMPFENKLSLLAIMMFGTVVCFWISAFMFSQMIEVAWYYAIPQLGSMIGSAACLYVAVKKCY